MRVGAVIQLDDGPDADPRMVGVVCKEVGWGTSNMAEYLAIVNGLEWAEGVGASEVVVYTDSQLVAQQVSGGYTTKSKRLRRLRDRVRDKLSGLNGSLVWHRRDEGLGPLADALAKGGPTSGEVFTKLVEQIDPTVRKI